jgi:HTH-type transcriptional regulator/antitoxin HipB
MLALFATRMKQLRQLVTTPNQLGEVIRGRRKARGMSQADLAAKLNVSQSRLSILESDPAGLTVARLLALASVLGLEIVIQDATSASGRGKSEW